MDLGNKVVYRDLAENIFGVSTVKKVRGEKVILGDEVIDKVDVIGIGSSVFEKIDDGKFTRAKVRDIKIGDRKFTISLDGVDRVVSFNKVVPRITPCSGELMQHEVDKGKTISVKKQRRVEKDA